MTRIGVLTLALLPVGAAFFAMVGIARQEACQNLQNYLAEDLVAIEDGRVELVVENFDKLVEPFFKEPNSALETRTIDQFSVRLPAETLYARTEMSDNEWRSSFSGLDWSMSMSFDLRPDTPWDSLELAIRNADRLTEIDCSDQNRKDLAELTNYFNSKGLLYGPSQMLRRYYDESRGALISLESYQLRNELDAKRLVHYGTLYINLKNKILSIHVGAHNLGQLETALLLTALEITKTKQG